MLTGILVVVAAGGCTLVASWFMWWATRRSALWAMAAGSLLAFIALLAAVAIAWVITRAAYGR